MRKSVLLAGILFVLTCGTNAWSSLGTITFDSPPDTVAPATVNTFVNTQYGSAYGVNFLYRSDFTGRPYYSLLGFTAGPLVGGTLGTPSGWTDEKGAATTYTGASIPVTNFLGFNKSPVTTDGSLSGTAMEFNSWLNSLSFKLDRSGTSGTTIVVTNLYNTATGALVGTNTTTITAGAGWYTINFPSSNNKVFNLAVVYSSDNKRFMLDDLSFNTVQRSRIDADGDGRTDIAVFRPSEGAWYAILSSDSSQQSYQWGSDGDIPVARDFDGDGKTDAAVWRPSEGKFYIQRSSDFMQYSIPWGTLGDTPVPGDYDGDGKADAAVWRNGYWFVINSSDSSQYSVAWGASGDTPVPGDYDGDGKTDVAVWRPSEGKFYIINSSDAGQHSVAWGTSDDTPVPGDYDGDGKTDVAIWRPSEGKFYIVNSSDAGQYSVAWGALGDTPVPGDYDGDGKTDVAVWRPSEGKFYITRSSDSTQYSVQWGTSGDMPIFLH